MTAVILLGIALAAQAKPADQAPLDLYRGIEIEILDREGLERQACECANALRIKTRRILSELE